METPRDPDPLLGSVVDGRYRLDRLLGRGGMGCVYAGQHVAIGRPVAIKVLGPELVSDDHARRRFEREAQASGRLRHANCIGVTDYGALPDGSPYLAMELVEGRTLEHVLDTEQRLGVDRAVGIMRHVLRALAHAHAQGLVHRDLKPCNVMLVSEAGDLEFAKLLDFGLARLLGGDSDRLTQTGIVCGTPRYMAPEQVLDQAIDARIDLYAASVIFFEMLTGHTPFDHDEPVTILRMHVNASIPAIADVAPDVVVPRPIEALIRRGLAKKPADRPASAELYLADLERACRGAGASTTAPKTAWWHRLPRPVLTRSRLIAAGAVATVLAIVVVAIAATGGDDKRPAAPVVTEKVDPATQHDELAMDPASAREPEIEAAYRLARSGRGVEAVEKLRALRRARPKDASIPYAMARLCDQLGWPRQTIDAYRDAIRLDPSLREDPTLIRDLIQLLDSQMSGDAAAYALEHYVGAAAESALAATATHHPSATVRARASRLQARVSAQ